MSFIPYGKQHIDEADIQAVVNVLRSDKITQGPAVKSFEEAIQSYCDSGYAIAVSNGTAALHLAYLALDVGQGDIVWTSPNTFLATANAAVMCGASVDFVDMDPDTYNLSPIALENKLIEASQKGCLPKVVTPVHFAGQSCDMQRIYELSLQYGFKIVEDASHAIGGYYLNQAVGCCQYSDIATFSFHPVKIVTTGEGGALTTNDKHLADKIACLSTHAMIRDEASMSEPKEGDWYYEMQALGYNYRITDIQCALGVSQMQKIDEFVQKRHQVRQYYDEHLAQLTDVTVPKQSGVSYSALHLYPIQVPQDKRKQLFGYLRQNHIGVNVHYIPVHLQPYYKKQGFYKGYCPNAEAYYARAISLPIYPDLTEEQLQSIITVIEQGLPL